MPSDVTVFGLGGMGGALAAALLKKGYRTTIWNRTAAKAAPLVEKGAELVTSLKAGFEASNFLVFCVLENNIVHEMLNENLSSLSGKIILNTTNGTSQQARDLSSFVSGHGGQYIHGAIMAVPAQIGTEDAFLLYSGPPELFASIQERVTALGGAKYVGLDPGLASLHDSALLSGLLGLFSGFIHSSALISSQPGETATGFMDSYIKFTTSMSDYLRALAEQIDTGHFTALGSTLGIYGSALKNICEVTESQGVSSELLKPLEALVEKAVEAGYGNSEISALTKLLRR
ncbi:hypothetical protein BDV26DRAFT_284461 [Aspergillus bertholletiae]|uniref:Uncharacterized protein n=1 Tax=Aspergillus bertholletiae TaxID=1226010 RepID=A0A5N7AWI1_9EURO|nr:hypothetical protein BDV26DRAFT_284461 [Aspergillus bertholletiae]